MAKKDLEKPHPALLTSQESLQTSGRLSMLVCGRSGVGKSSLVNSLLGREVCEVGDPGLQLAENSLSGCTKLTKENCLTLRNGIQILIYDSPGLQDGTNDEEAYLNDMYTKCKDVDLVLYCIEMNDPRFQIEDSYAIDMITPKFGPAIWMRCVLVLTKANLVHVHRKYAKKPVTYHENVFKNKQSKFLSVLRNSISDEDKIPAKIPVVAVGHHQSNEDDEHWGGRYIYFASENSKSNDPQSGGNSDRVDFIAELWVTCLETIPESSRVIFLQATASNGRLQQEGKELTGSLKMIMEAIETKLEQVPANNNPEQESGNATPEQAGDDANTTPEQAGGNGDANTTSEQAGGNDDENTTPEQAGGNDDENTTLEQVGGNNDESTTPEQAGGNDDENTTPEQAGGNDDENTTPEQAGGNYDENTTPEQAGGNYDTNTTPEQAGGNGDTNTTPEQAGGNGDTNTTPEQAGGNGDTNTTPEQADGSGDANTTPEQAGGNDDANTTLKQRGHCEQQGNNHVENKTTLQRRQSGDAPTSKLNLNSDQVERTLKAIEPRYYVIGGVGGAVAGAGLALSGTTVGVKAGALLGSAAGPVGAMVGAAVGAVAGAGIGYVVRAHSNKNNDAANCKKSD